MPLFPLNSETKPIDISLISSYLNSMLIQAVRLPLAFFLGTSLIVRPIDRFSMRLLLFAHVVYEQTWRQTLLEFLCSIGIFEDESVEVTLASNLEFDGVGLLVLLNARRCRFNGK